MQEIEKRLRKGETIYFFAHDVRYRFFCESRERHQMFVVQPEISGGSKTDGLAFRRFGSARQFITLLGCDEIQ